jgi:type I restriction enzyme, S subunit
MKNISQEKLLSMRLSLPPIDLQQAFAARIAEIDNLKAHHRAHLAKLDVLFASLQHRAFRGEL